jgi:hypothetical protein
MSRENLWLPREKYNLERVVSLLGPNFALCRTQYSCYAYSTSSAVIFSDRYIGRPLVALIGKFRNHVRARLRAGKIDMNLVDKPIFSGGKMPADGVELDIYHAYAVAAHRVGACTSGWLKYLNRITRKARLMILGSLGTVRWKTEYKDGAPGDTVTETDFELRAVYDQIRAYVDRAARSAAGSDGYYWVDAVFVPTARMKLAQKILRAAGLRAKRPQKTYILKTSKSGKLLRLGDGRVFPALAEGVAQ